MARGLSCCQFDFHDVRVLANWVLVLAMAIWSVVTVSAQQPGKLEAEAADLARRTLAAKLSLPIERIRIVSVSPAEWRDSSLGCPERGMIYTPVMTSGYKVRVRDLEREHVVHVGSGHAVICSSEVDPKISP